MRNIPLSLYIHIPWCEKKCPYCDFNSHMARAEIDEAAYVQALLNDLDDEITTFQTAITSRKIQSIFIGGGTPSLFSAESIHTLLDELAKRLDFAPDIEITLEANPGSSEANKFMGFRQAGVNRLSIGVQSFNPGHLSILGRVHSSNEANNAASYAKAAGFKQFNLDLMFGLPEQTIDQAIEDLSIAINCDATHLSCYQLTIEPNTLFHAQPPVTPDNETLWEMQTVLQEMLKDNGYVQYEVSAYAKQNSQCRHNLNYWQFGDYLGIGAGAHGKLSLENGEIIRRWKIKHPATYISKDNKLGGQNNVEANALPFEYMLNALRLTDGFNLEQFEQRTRLLQSDIQVTLGRHEALRLLTIEGSNVRPSERGKQLIDAMLQDYLS